VIQPKADTQPIIATATAVKYPITKSRFNIALLLTVEATGINWVRLFMATLLRSNYAGWASRIANWFNVWMTPRDPVNTRLPDAPKGSAGLSTLAPHMRCTRHAKIACEFAQQVAVE
jgi:hypothetical protein